MICHGHGILALIHKPRLVVWLTEVFWHACLNSFAIIKDLLDSPSIFTFRLVHVSAEHVASLSPHLNILRYGLDDGLVMLREDGQAARKEGAK